MRSEIALPTASIVGAGLAGLSAAIALRRAGWRVTIYERSQFKNEIGAAIVLNPSATRSLVRWGFNFKKARPSNNVQMITRKADDLTVIGEEQYPGLKEKWGYESLLFHRVDLHNCMLELATGEDCPGEAVEVALGSKVIELNCEKGLVVFENGMEIMSDLVVIADGAHSKLVSVIKGEPVESVSTGRSLFRFLLPMDKVLADPYLRELYEDGKAGFRINIDFANDVLFMNYQCRSDTVLNCAIVHHTRKDQDESDVWNSRASVAQTLEICQNFHPVLKRYIELCEEEDIKVHHSMKRLPLPSFVSGRALVLGDAAHVMLPTHAAGLTVAVESAAALEPIMSGIRSGEEHSVKERLGLWNNLRNGRCNFVMLMSNAGPGGLNLPGVEDEIRKYYGGRLPPKEAMLWTEKSREVFFDCDAVAEAKTAMLNAGFMLD